MDEKELLETDLGSLKNAYTKIQEALNYLKDVEDFENKPYVDLFYISEEINELIIDKKIKLERMEEI